MNASPNARNAARRCPLRRRSHSVAIISILLLNSCRLATVGPQPSRVSPTEVPTSLVTALIPFTLPPSARQAWATPTPVPVPPLRSAILVAYNPAGREMLSDVWLLRPGQDLALSLALHDDNSAYCCGVWSPDGSQIAFVRTSFAQSSSSLWVANPDGSATRQVSREYVNTLPPQGIPTYVPLQGIQDIVPLGWSPNAAEIFLAFEDSYLAVNIQDASERLVTPPTAGLFEYNQVAGLLAMHFHDEARDAYDFIVFDPFADHAIARIPADPDYTPVGHGGYAPGFEEVSLSSDGVSLAVSDFNWETNVESLWIVDVLSGVWERPVSRPLLYAPASVIWSPDDHWIAWYVLVDEPIHNEDRAFFTFISTDDWQITRDVEFWNLTGAPRVVGWVNDETGRAWFGALLPETGIVLLDPTGQDGADPSLVPYRRLAASLPFPPEDAEQWSWQP